MTKKKLPNTINWKQPREDSTYCYAVLESGAKVKVEFLENRSIWAWRVGGIASTKEGAKELAEAFYEGKHLEQ